jgi:hypothetical protein
LSVRTEAINCDEADFEALHNHLRQDVVHIEIDPDDELSEDRGITVAHHFLQKWHHMLFWR